MSDVNVGTVYGILQLRDTNWSSTVSSSVRDIKQWEQVVSEATTSAAARVGRAMTTVGSSVSRAGQILSVGLTVPLAGAAVAATKFAADYEAAMVKVGTLSENSASDVAAMSEEVLRLAPTVGKGPQELAEALLVVTSTGLKGAEAMDVLTASAKASAVGLGDTKDVARAITSAVMAYGSANLSASKAAEVLFKAVKDGGAEADQFAGTLGRVVGISAQLGVSFEDVTGFIATFTRLGVDASEATTALRGTMSELLKPSAASKKALAEVGESVKTVTERIQKNGLAAGLADLMEKLKGNDQALAAIFPNVRALAGILGTAGSQADAFAEIEKHLKESTDELGDSFQRTTKTTAFTFAAFRAEVEVLAIRLGNELAPSFRAIVEGAKPLLGIAEALVRMFAALPDPIKGTAIATAALVAILGPLGILLGGVTNLTGSVVTAYGYLTAAGAAATASNVALAASNAGVGASATVAAAGITAMETAVQADLLATLANDLAASGTQMDLLAGVANTAAISQTGFATATEVAGASAAAAATEVSLLGSAVAFATGPWGIAIALLGGLATATYLAATAESDMEKAVRENATGFGKQTNAMASALDTYKALSSQTKLTKDEANRLDSATRTLAQASGLSKEQFEKEAKASDTLTVAFRDQIRARKDLYTQAINEARTKWAEAVEAQAAAEKLLHDTLTNQRETVAPAAGPGGAPVARGMTPAERNNEIQRLNGVLADLRRNTAQAEGAFTTLAGVTAKWIDLGGPAVAATKGTADSLDALAKAQKEYDDEVQKNGLDTFRKAMELHKQFGKSVEEAAAAYGLTVPALERYLTIQQGVNKSLKESDAGKFSKSVRELATSLGEAQAAGAPLSLVLAEYGAKAADLVQKAPLFAAALTQPITDLAAAWSNQKLLGVEKVLEAETAFKALSSAIAASGGDLSKLDVSALRSEFNALDAGIGVLIATGAKIAPQWQEIQATVGGALSRMDGNLKNTVSSTQVLAQMNPFGTITKGVTDLISGNASFDAASQAVKDFQTALAQSGSIGTMSLGSLRTTFKTVEEGIAAMRRAGQPIPQDWKNTAQVVGAELSRMGDDISGVTALENELVKAQEAQGGDTLARRISDIQREFKQRRDALRSAEADTEEYGRKLQILGQIEAQVTKNATEEWNRANSTLRGVSTVLGIVAEGFGTLGQIAGGSLAAVVKAIGGIAVAWDGAVKGFLAFRDALQKNGGGLKGLGAMLASQLAGGFLSGFAGIMSATTFTSTLKNAFAGGLTGAAYGAGIGATIAVAIGHGAMAGGIWGAVAGFAVGVIVGVFRGAATRRTMHQVGEEWGHDISQGLAQTINKEAKELFQGSRDAAQIFNLADTLSEVGGVSTKNYAKAIKELRDTFSQLELGVFNTSQAQKVLNDNFGTFVDLTMKNGVGLITSKLREIVKLDREFGTNSSAIASFVAQQMGRAFEGFNAIAANFTETWTGTIEDASSQLDDLTNKEKTLKAEIGGLTKLDQLTPKQAAQLSTWKTQLWDVESQIRDLNEEMEKAGKVSEAMIPGSAEEFDRLGRIAVATFTAALASGETVVQAIGDIQGGLDSLRKATNYGFTAKGSFADLLGLSDFVEKNQAVVAAADGLNGILQGLQNSAFLDQQTFTDLGDEAVNQFQKMIASGATTDQAFKIMQPSLQTIWELQKDFGFAVDDATQALLDQAEASGQVGEKNRSVQEQTLDVLERMSSTLDALATAFGVTLPSDIDKTKGSVGDLGGALDDAVAKIPDNIDIPVRWGVPPIDLPKIPTVTIPVNYPRYPEAYGPGGEPIQYASGGPVGMLPGYAMGGPVYAASGFYVPRGTDTIPAMLSPGEFVMPSLPTSRVGIGALNYIKSTGTLPTGGSFAAPPPPASGFRSVVATGPTDQGGTMATRRMELTVKVDLGGATIKDDVDAEKVGFAVADRLKRNGALRTAWGDQIEGIIKQRTPRGRAS